MRLVKRTWDSLANIGIACTALKVARYPFTAARRYLTHLRLSTLSSQEERFTWIYRNNYWQSDESASGTGSTLAYTANLRAELPKLFVKFSIRRILDAPCGDFHWMRIFTRDVDVEYIGADIVKPLIQDLNVRYGDQKRTFIHLDLVAGKHPKADLMICRDCLFHLSYADTRAVLKNFVESGTPYLLTTTHRNDGSFKNHDIQTGFYRRIDLTASPYNLPGFPLARIDDWLAPDPEREMCLWSREQVAEALEKFGR